MTKAWIGFSGLAAAYHLSRARFHGFGLIWLIPGTVLMLIALTLMLKEVRERRTNRLSRNDPGSDDFGSMDYHTGDAGSDGSCGRDGGD